MILERAEGITFGVKLKSKWQSYNCGLRLPGLLGLEFSRNGEPITGSLMSDPLYFKWYPRLQEFTDDLILEFIASLDKPETYPALRDNNVFWPADYVSRVPTAIIFHDAVADYTYPRIPLTSWRALIRHFEDNPGKYPIEVTHGPIFQNKTYGAMGHLTRCWFLVPSFNKKFYSGDEFLDNVAALKISAERSADILSSAEKAELEEILKARQPLRAAGQ